MLVWDNEAGVGKGCLTSEFAAFAGLLAIRVHLCRPRDPEAKDLVERANGYLETSFLPGRLFTGPDDLNTQLTAWLQIANRRHHRSIDARPVGRWGSDRASMLAIPPVGPPHWWPLRTRLGRDHYIRVDTNDYSVHPRAIGHIVTVHADTEEITVTCGDDLVARHTRCWAKHQSLTDPEHAAAARNLRGPAAADAVCARRRDLGAFEAGGGQVAAGGVAQFLLAVPVGAGGDGADSGVRAVRVRDQQQAFQQLGFVDGLAGADWGEGLEHGGAQGGFLEDVDQGNGAPLLLDRLLELAQVLRLRLRLGLGELDGAAALAAPMVTQGSLGMAVSRAPSSARISAFSWAVNAFASRGLLSFS
jgi:hypothetical protein